MRKREVGNLAKEMMTSLAGRTKFKNFSWREFDETASLFVESGFGSWKQISLLDGETRKFLRGNLTDGGCSERQLCLVNDVFSHYENEKPRSSVADAKGVIVREVPFEEVMIPERMIRWNVNLSSLTGWLVPDQDMANVFTKAMAGAAKKDPPFSPFATPKLHQAPRIVPLQPRERAAKFRKDIISHKNGAQQVRLQAWLLYMLRFVFTGDICSAWSNFGGLAAQFCMLSAVIHLAVVETAAFAIAYDAELRGRTQRLARRRDTQVDFAKMLSEENEDVKRYLEIDLGKGKAPAKADPPKGHKGVGHKGKGAKASANSPNWIQIPQTTNVVGKGKGDKKGK